MRILFRILSYICIYVGLAILMLRDVVIAIGLILLIFGILFSFIEKKYD